MELAAIESESKDTAGLAPAPDELRRFGKVEVAAGASLFAFFTAGAAEGGTQDEANGFRPGIVSS